jgi:hypothetical protein
MPAMKIFVGEQPWVFRRIVETPIQKPIPFVRLFSLAECPAEFLQSPVSLRAIAEHGSRYPILLPVHPSAADRDDVVNGGEEFPIYDMALRHLPVSVRGEFLRQDNGQEPKRPGENEPLSSIPVAKAIPQKDPH